MANTSQQVVARPSDLQESREESSAPEDRTRTEARDQREQYIRLLMEDAKLTREQALAVVDQTLSEQMPLLQGAAQQSNTIEANSLNNMMQYLLSPEQGSITPAEFVGDYDSSAANAYADPKARKAQYAALEQLLRSTNPELTAQEKLMSAEARQGEERDTRAAREATLADLAARGQRSGTAEMAGMLGGQEVTSRNRQLGDLAALASAQGRAERSTTEYGEQAGVLAGQTFDERFQTGTAADRAVEFNKDLRQAYDKSTQDFRLGQQESRFDRQSGVADRATDYATNTFGRQDTVTGRAMQGSGQKVAALGGGFGMTSEALKIALGKEEADKGVAATKDDDDGIISEALNYLW